MYACIYAPVCARNVCMTVCKHMYVYMYDVCMGGMYDPVYGW